MRIKANRYIVFVTILIIASVFFHFTRLSYAQDEKNGRKVLYYRNPMNPAITSLVPAKDQMGMDYIPVYEKENKPEAANAGAEAKDMVNLSQRDISLAGIISQPVTKMHLFKDIRTVGKVAYDPVLYKAEEELIQAVKAKKSLEKSQIVEVKDSLDSLVDAAKLKLSLNGLSADQIESLVLQQEPDRSLIISDKDSPYVWVYADIYEYELSWIRVGQPVNISTISFPDEEFKGRIEAIDPILNPMTRSVRVRVKIDNLQLKLKPQMYVDVFIEAYLIDENGKHKVSLAIPEEALLDTGMRKLVYLDLGNGSYQGIKVQVGPKAAAYVDGQKMNFYPVTSGIKEGDKVVTKANFLIDSQSQLSGAASSAYSGAISVKEEEK